jgi:hypothetical protein
MTIRVGSIVIWLKKDFHRSVLVYTLTLVKGLLFLESGYLLGGNQGLKKILLVIILRELRL